MIIEAGAVLTSLLLDREMLNVDKPRMFNRSIRVHRVDGSLVIFIKQCRPRLREIKLDENGPQLLLGGNQALRHSRVGASDSDVVDLSLQKDDLPVIRTSVDSSLVYGVILRSLVSEPKSSSGSHLILN
jgi:hypothetical protein